MTATGHAIVGTVLAAKIGNPALGIPLAILSHLATDAFPHWDTGTNGDKKHGLQPIIEAVIDVLAGFGISYAILFYFFPSTDLVYAFCMIIAAQSFDWLTAPYYFFNINIPPFTWAYQFQKMFDNRLDKPWGIINQVAFLVLLIVGASRFF